MIGIGEGRLGRILRLVSLWGGMLMMISGVFAAHGDEATALTREWAERAFSVEGAPHSLDHLVVLHDDEPGTAKLNRCAAGGPIRLGERIYNRGIGVNSNCTLRVTLSRPAVRLKADIGVDRNVDNSIASLRFHVVAAGKELFATDVLRPDGQIHTLDVALAGARTFDLLVSDGGDGRGWDQGDWADARVVLEDGTEVWLDELMRTTAVAPGIPFSFVYGGRHSADFLPSWDRAMAEEQLDGAALRRTLTLVDPETGLEVRAVATIYTDTPGVDWTLHFANRGDALLPPIENLRTLDVSIYPGMTGTAPVLHRISGSSNQDDWLPSATPLLPGETVSFEPAGGRSSAGDAAPFFCVEWPGGGVVTALGWTGQWMAQADRADGTLRLSAGMKNLRLRLKPGEEIRGPRVLQVWYAGHDPYRPYNLFRRTMLAHIVPKVEGETIVPPIAHLSTAFYELDSGTEADVLSHLEAMEGLGFEYLWLDAYYGRDDFPAIGNYVLPLERSINQDRFPRGIAPIGEAVHKAGLKFLLWMEPERITPGTLMATEHPEWVVMPPNNGWGMVNLGLPEAREYVTECILAAIREYGVDCLRIDNAVAYSSLWSILDAEAGPDRVGLAEIRYIEGLYRMWDDILAANPHLFIDNCASGGQRIDLETCSRSIPLWRTDGTIEPLFRKDFDEAALRNQAMTAGLSRYLPFHVSGQMGASPYHFRSGFNAGISFAEDIRASRYPREQLRDAIAEGKRIRKYFFGDFYPLTETTTADDGWSILQYHRPEHQDGMLIAFRRPESLFTAFSLMALREIDPEAEYEIVESHSYEPGKPLRVRGAELLARSLSVPETPDSVIMEYRRLIQ